ncbi:MAG: DUF86 domain-containing protein [Planctomycetes bacterium]|nr:DUF86 domain-containing protein [Planctomycetota bacterium]
MSRSWVLFLRDMLEGAAKIERFTAGKDLAGFAADAMAYDAVIRNLELLGEAAKNIPEEIRRRYPQVDWRSIAGLRDVLAHSYFALDDATLWRIIREDVRRIAPELERIARENP